MLKYSSFLYFFAVVNFVLGQQLDIIMLGRMWPDPSEISYYFIGYNLAYFSVSFFTMALAGGISLTLYSELYARRNYKGLRDLFSAYYQYMYLTIIPIAIGGALIGPDLLVWIFGSEYQGAVPIFTLFIFTLIVIKYGGLTSTVMNAMGKERKIVVSRGMFGIANVCLNLYLIPKHGALGAVMGTSIAYMIGIMYEAYVTHKLLHPKYPVAFTIKILAASLVMGGLMYILQPYAAWYFLIVLGSAAYLALLILLKPISGDIVEIIEDAVPVRILSRALHLFCK